MQAQSNHRLVLFQRMPNSAEIVGIEMKGRDLAIDAGGEAVLEI